MYKNREIDQYTKNGQRVWQVHRKVQTALKHMERYSTTLIHYSSLTGTNPKSWKHMITEAT